MIVRFQVLVTDYAWDSLAIERSVLDGIGAKLVVAPTGAEQELIELAADVDAILTNWKGVTGRVLEAAPRCKTVARYGVGVDNIDVARATELGMVVTRVPDYSVEEVADHTWALLLALARRVVQFDRSVRSGSWDNREAGPILRLRGLTLGILGFGIIGRAVAERALPFGLTPFVATRSPGSVPTTIRTSRHIDEVVRSADFLSLHLPLTEETRHVIDARRLALMKPTACLINTGRGALVDEDALAQALLAGHIAGAALDVRIDEPPLDSRLASIERVISTPHAGFYSEASIAELARRSAEHVAAVLSNRLPPPGMMVNPDVLERPTLRVQFAD